MRFPPAAAGSVPTRVAVAALALVTLALTGCGGGSATAPPPAAASSSSSSSPSPSPSPSPKTTVPADPKDPIALTAANAADYRAYLATLSPSLRADASLFDDPKVFKGKSYKELKAYFAIPASLVTKDGTVDTLDRQAYASAVSARLKGLATLIDAELTPDAGFTQEKATEMASAYYPGAHDGFLRDLANPGQQTTAEQTPSAVGHSALRPSNVLGLQKIFNKDVPGYQLFMWPAAGTVTQPKPDRVEFQLESRDNFPTTAFEETVGLTWPATNQKEHTAYEEIVIDEAGHVLGSPT